MVKIFISYAHEDRSWCEDLVKFLKPWEPNLVCWYDRYILPGGLWRRNISRELDSAGIVLALISSSYLASPFCKSELQRARVNKRKRSILEIIPIWIEPSVFSDALSDLQYYPSDRPISKYPDRNEALTQVSNEIGKIAAVLANRVRSPNLERDPSELRELLHQLCDRERQSDVIESSLPDTDRPLVIITRGWPEDLPDRFITRLDEGLLPDPFRGEKACHPPGFDPRSGEGATPEQMFLPSIRRATDLDGSRAGAAEINTRMQSMGKVVLLAASFPAKEWGTRGLLGSRQAPGEVWLTKYLELWRKWPAVAAGHAIVAVVSITYGAEKINKQINRFLDELKNESSDPFIAFNVLVLRQFEQIDYVHMQKWIEFPQVQQHFKSWQAAKDALHVIFPADDTEYRMQPLAEQQLSVWLDRCEE